MPEQQDSRAAHLCRWTASAARDRAARSAVGLATSPSDQSLIPAGDCRSQQLRRARMPPPEPERLISVSQPARGRVPELDRAIVPNIASVGIGRERQTSLTAAGGRSVICTRPAGTEGSSPVVRARSIRRKRCCELIAAGSSPLISTAALRILRSAANWPDRHASEVLAAESIMRRHSGQGTCDAPAARRPGGRGRAPVPIKRAGAP